jgi:hypothetical protein
MRLAHLKVGKFDLIRNGRQIPLPKAIESRLAPLPEFIAAVAAAVAAPADRDTLQRWNCELRQIFFAPQKTRCGVVIALRRPNKNIDCSEDTPIIMCKRKNAVPYRERDRDT